MKLTKDILDIIISAKTDYLSYVTILLSTKNDITKVIDKLEIDIKDFVKLGDSDKIIKAINEVIIQLKDINYISDNGYVLLGGVNEDKEEKDRITIPVLIPPKKIYVSTYNYANTFDMNKIKEMF